MGSFTRPNAIERVWRYLRDTGDEEAQQLLTDTEVGDHVDAAVRDYSRDRPLVKVLDKTADGTNTLAVPTTNEGWVDEWSRIHSIEWPLDQNPPQVVDDRQYMLYQAPSSYVIRWLTEWPGNGETVRVSFTTLRVLHATVASSTTVLDIDFDALCYLATSKAALAIAGQFARTNEPAFNADTINYKSKAEEWRSIAGRWQGLYSKAIMSQRPPSSGRVNWDARLGSGHYPLTHERLRR